MDDHLIDKPLPHSLEAERSVLGAVIIDPDAIVKVIPILPDPSDFFLRQNQLIYKAMQSLMANGQPIDTVPLMDVLGTAGQLDGAGGVAYLSTLADGLPRTSNVEHYARIVRRKARARQLLHFADQLRCQAFDDDSPDLPERAISDLLAIASDSREVARARQWQDIATSAVNQLVSAKLNPDKSARIFFGIKSLDEATSGLRRKELALIVAPTSNGKTLLAMQGVMQASRDGFRSLYFSAEMPAEQLAMREIAYRAGVKFYFVQRPEILSTDELARLQEAASEPASVTIVDQDITPTRIWAMAEAAKRAHGGLDLVVVDYDQLVIEAGIDPKSDDDNVFRHQRSFMLTAKRLAERLDICFLLLCQMRKISAKVAEGATPRLDDIWGDSSVRNTPHLILWLVREYFRHNMEINYERKACVYVLKARNGRTCSVPIEFDPERVRFLCAPENEEIHVPF